MSEATKQEDESRKLNILLDSAALMASVLNDNAVNRRPTDEMTSFRASELIAVLAKLLAARKAVQS